MGMTVPLENLQTGAFNKAGSFKIVTEDNANTWLPLKDFAVSTYCKEYINYYYILGG